MNLKSLLKYPSMALFAIILVACNMPITGGPTQIPGSIFTQAAQTSSALPTNTSPVNAFPTNLPTQATSPLPPTPITQITPTETATPEPSATPIEGPVPTEANCSDAYEFVDDITIPDGTELLPGEEFVKTWRLLNTGTCTWTTQYGLIFVSGDLMNGTSPFPLSAITSPGSTADVSITLKAPGTPGTYQGDWQLVNPAEVRFGSVNNPDATFYVQIKVVEGTSELNLGNPTWVDNLDNADNWYLLETPNTIFSEGDGKLVLKSIHPASGEEWDISTKPSSNDYYLQATFITGSACSGRDKYGLLARAPDPEQGYVFEFSCDGQYRLYTWENDTYHALQDWQPAASILTGPNQTNIMGFYLKGDTLQLYANKHKIGEFTDDTFDHGQYGLVIGSMNTENFTVYVDQVEYWELTQ
ncbi:MAG: NBR1-Ig-like domain-containing protein [Acidobacteriaceae bacterium]